MYSEDTEKKTKLLSLILLKDHQSHFVEDEIRRNIFNLLNSRSTAKLDDFLKEGEKNFDFRHYGLPELSSINFQTQGGANMLCKVITASVSSFEPRISNFSVHFIRFDSTQKNVFLTIKGCFKESLSSINIVLQLGLWEFKLV